MWFNVEIPTWTLCSVMKYFSNPFRADVERSCKTKSYQCMNSQFITITFSCTSMIHRTAPFVQISAISAQGDPITSWRFVFQSMTQQYRSNNHRSWRRRDRGTFSVQLALCEINALVTKGLPWEMGGDVDLLLFLCCYLDQVVEQTVELAVILFPVRLMWHHCYVRILHLYCDFLSRPWR